MIIIQKMEKQTVFHCCIERGLKYADTLSRKIHALNLCMYSPSEYGKCLFISWKHQHGNANVLTTIQCG